MKKLLALLTAMLLFVVCLSGCGGGVDNSKQKPAADKDDITITVWSGDGGGQALWEEMIDEWNASEGDEKNIFVNWKTIMDSSQIDVAEQSGQLPEIVGASGGQVRKFANTGSIVPLSEFPGGEEYMKEYDYPGIENYNIFDGKQYSVLRKAVTSALVYNKELFKQAGIVDEKGEAKPPKTIAELREAAKKINALGEGIYGFAFPLDFSLGYTVGALTTPSFNVAAPASSINLDTLTVSYEGYKEMYQWILDLKNDGSVMPGAETLDNDSARAYFSSGVVGMIPAISWDVGVYTTQLPADCDWDVCKFPTLDGRERWMEYASISGGLVLSKNALKDQRTAEATMEVYKYIYSLDVRTRLFEEGIDLSCKADVLEKADMDKVDSRFVKFAELVDKDYKSYPSESYVVEGENWQTMFQKVWMGDISLDAAINDFENRSTQGLRKAVQNGTYDVAKQKATQAQQLADFEELKEKRK